MKRIYTAIAILIVSLPIPSYSKENAVVNYLPQALETKKGAMPACTPVEVKSGKKSVTIRDLNKSWPKAKLSASEFDSVDKLKHFDECVAAVEAYKGRYNESHLTAMSEGRLAATMPIEFALMIMGPPKQRPSYMSMANPITGEVETLNTYVYVNLWGNRGTVRTVFMLLGGAALGTAALSSGVGTTIDALNVASAANLATWAVSDFSQARFVSLTAKDGSITMVMAN